MTDISDCGLLLFTVLCWAEREARQVPGREGGRMESETDYTETQEERQRDEKLDSSRGQSHQPHSIDMKYLPGQRLQPQFILHDFNVCHIL